MEVPVDRRMDPDDRPGRGPGRRSAVVVAGTDRPIGLFDSGVGGLTVARAVIDLLPHEDIIYFGDTARCPYGPRPASEVRKFALEIMDALVEEDVKLLVIACNSAASTVLDE